jgi:hypothetical protein
MKVGDKVVCLIEHTTPDGKILYKDKIYTLIYNKCDCGKCVHLEGVPLPTLIWSNGKKYIEKVQRNNAQAKLAKEAMKEERNPVKKREYEEV